jgi:hypothetical protein
MEEGAKINAMQWIKKLIEIFPTLEVRGKRRKVGG